VAASAWEAVTTNAWDVTATRSTREVMRGWRPSRWAEAGACEVAAGSWEAAAWRSAPSFSRHALREAHGHPPDVHP
jgi:hypothetical protein